MMESSAQRAVKFARALVAYYFLQSLYCSFLDLSVLVLLVRLIICFSLVKSVDECELRLKSTGPLIHQQHLRPSGRAANEAPGAQQQQQQQQGPVFTPFGTNLFLTGSLNQAAAGGDHSNVNVPPHSPGSIEISTDLAAQVKGTRERWKLCVQCSAPAIVLHLLWGFYPSLPFVHHGVFSSSTGVRSGGGGGGVPTAEALALLLWEYKLSTAKFWTFTAAAEPCGEYSILTVDLVLLLVQYVLMTLLVLASGSPGDGSVVPVLPRPPRSVGHLFQVQGGKRSHSPMESVTAGREALHGAGDQA